MANSSESNNLHTATNILFFITGAVCCIAGIYYIWHENIAALIAIMPIGLLFLLAATLDRFESLKGLGVEAKTRVLDKKINEAEETLQRLKQLAELSGASLIELMSRVGRTATPPAPHFSHSLARKIRDNLQAVNADNATILSALKPWVANNISDLRWHLLKSTLEELQKAYDISNRNRLFERHPKLDIGHDPEANKKCELIETHIKTLDPCESWPYDEVITMIIDFISKAPLIDETLKKKAIETADSWKDETNGFIKSFDYPTPLRWYAVIESRIEGFPHTYQKRTLG